MKKLKALTDLTPDAGNANDHTLRGTQLLDRSLERHGAIRGITTDKNGRTVAGNALLELAVARGYRIRVVQSDGSKLIAAQRMDLDLTTPEGRELALLDNQAAAAGLSWNPTAIERDLAAGIELGSMFDDGELTAVLGSIDRTLHATEVEFSSEDSYAAWLAFIDELNPTTGEDLALRLAAWMEAQQPRLETAVIAAIEAERVAREAEKAAGTRVIWNEQTGNLVGGHQRFKVLVARGDKVVDVSVVNLSLEEEKALNLALNKITGRWNDSKTQAVLEDLKQSGFNLELTGFGDEGLEALASSLVTFTPQQPEPLGQLTDSAVRPVDVTAAAAHEQTRFGAAAKKPKSVTCPHCGRDFGV